MAFAAALPVLAIPTAPAYARQPTTAGPPAAQSNEQKAKGGGVSALSLIVLAAKIAQQERDRDHCSPASIRTAVDHRIAPKLTGCVYEKVAPILLEFKVTSTARNVESEGKPGLILVQVPASGQTIEVPGAMSFDLSIAIKPAQETSSSQTTSSQAPPPAVTPPKVPPPTVTPVVTPPKVPSQATPPQAPSSEATSSEATPPDTEAAQVSSQGPVDTVPPPAKRGNLRESDGPGLDE
ncbi:MAG: hypothetical protein ACXU8O_09480, partial [Asticcacaulis sp.]